MQLERRAGAHQVLDRRPSFSGSGIVKDQVALAEGPALRILPGQPDRDPARDQRGKRQLLGLRPIDFPLRQRRPASIHLAHQFGMHGEALADREQLSIQRLEHLGGHGGLDIRLRGGVHRRTAHLGRVRRAGFNVLVGIRQPRLGGFAPRLRVLGTEQPFLDQLRGENVTNRRMFLDGLVHHWLRVCRFVGLVVAKAAVSDQVDDDVAAEFLPEGRGQPHRAHASGDVVGVDVNDRQVEAFRHIRGVAGRSSFFRIRRETELVVGDDVQGTASRVALQLCEVEDFSDDALRGEGRVAVDQDRHRARAVEMRLRTLAPGLLGARPTLDDWIDRLEVTGIGQQRDRYLLAIRRDVGALSLRVVLHITGHVTGLEPVLALFELHEQ